jgi:ribonucleotide reductase alpha subunit
MENKYTGEQLREAALSYFNGDVLASNVWINKYALKKDDAYLELSPKDTIERMIREISRMEQKYPNPLSENEIRSVLGDFKHFIFGGSILFGLGNDNQLSSIGNCFFIDNGADSYGGIFNIDENAAQLMKRRGGVGITLENLRPATSAVNNSAHSSTGSTSFMHRYSNTTREVAQDGRRGAMMISFHINHPDVRSFITKKDDRTQVTGANISVKVTDEFMFAVEADEDFLLRYPVDYHEPVNLTQLQYNKLIKLPDGAYVMKVKAKEIWNLIIKQAHKNAEPGVLFWDNILRESPADCYIEEGMTTKGTNPCVVGTTLISTADGRNAVSIKQLSEEGKDIPVYTTNPITGKKEIKWGRNPRLTKNKAEVWKLTLDDDSELIATPDHHIMTSKNGYKKLKDLIEGESLIPFYSYVSNKLYRQISGSGAEKSGGQRRSRRQYRLIYDFFNGFIDAKDYAIHHKDFDGQNDNIDNLEKMTHEMHRELHAKLMMGDANPYHKMTPEWKHKFASHPKESNGRYSGHSNEEILDLGKTIFALEGKLTRNLWYLYARKAGMPLRLSNNFRFGSFTNFKNQVATNHKVKSVEFYGYEDVYNLTVDDNHNYDVITSFEDDKFITSSGITVKNCGEVPLSPYDSCRLGSICLNNVVLNPYTEYAQIDWPMLEKTTRYAQRFMDDIVSLEEEKVLAILAKIVNDKEPMELKQVEFNLWTKVLDTLRKGRRTGLGDIGLGDMLAKLGMKYDSPESTELKEKVQQFIAINSYRESIKLAKERGCFPIWNLYKEESNPFINRILEHLSVEDAADYVMYGRRNIANMAIAPTGSLGIWLGTTSGIEPLFAIFYKRKRKVNPNDKTLSRAVTTDDNGDVWEEYPVFHNEFVSWFSLTNPLIKEPLKHLESLPDSEITKIVFQSPWSGSESHDVNPIEKVKSQGAIQKWVDHSISITHNLPEKATLEEVSNIYFQAWKAGCKGCTVYREGSRDGILITAKSGKENEFTEHDAPKRPKEIPADYFVATANGKKYAVIVGLLNDHPYEIFAFENPPMFKNTKGVIVKVKKGHYKFINGEFEIDNIHLAAELLEERAHTIWVSMLLRHGAPIEHIVNVAKKVDDNITSFSSVVRRTLSKYLPEEATGEKCPSCSQPLIREEGCVHCSVCEYSRCG